MPKMDILNRNFYGKVDSMKEILSFLAIFIIIQPVFAGDFISEWKYNQLEKKLDNIESQLIFQSETTNKHVPKYPKEIKLNFDRNTQGLPRVSNIIYEDKHNGLMDYDYELLNNSNDTSTITNDLKSQYQINLEKAEQRPMPAFSKATLKKLKKLGIDTESLKLNVNTSRAEGKTDAEIIQLYDRIIQDEERKQRYKLCKTIYNYLKYPLLIVFCFILIVFSFKEYKNREKFLIKTKTSLLNLLQNIKPIQKFLKMNWFKIIIIILFIILIIELKP